MAPHRPRPPRRRYAPDRGAAAVEFALVLPVLLTLVFGIIDLGRALDAHIMLTEAASEAARSLAIGRTVDQAKTDARTAVDGSSVVDPDDLQFQTSGPCTATSTISQSNVKVTWRFQLLTPLALSATSFTFTGVGARRCAA